MVWFTVTYAGKETLCLHNTEKNESTENRDLKYNLLLNNKIKQKCDKNRIYVIAQACKAR